MGPVYPLEEMFKTMDQRDLDFWGITMFHEYKEGDPFGTIPYGYIPNHIQSHFIAVRKPMLNSLEYQMYWDHMQMIHDYREAVGCHEAIFTKRFADAGLNGMFMRILNRITTIIRSSAQQNVCWKRNVVLSLRDVLLCRTMTIF